jgi:hypothetical protein
MRASAAQQHFLTRSYFGANVRARRLVNSTGFYYDTLWGERGARKHGLVFHLSRYQVSAVYTILGGHHRGQPRAYVSGSVLYRDIFYWFLALQAEYG